MRHKGHTDRAPRLAVGVDVREPGTPVSRATLEDVLHHGVELPAPRLDESRGRVGVGVQGPGSGRGTSGGPTVVVGAGPSRGARPQPEAGGTVEEVVVRVGLGRPIAGDDDGPPPLVRGGEPRVPGTTVPRRPRLSTPVGRALSDRTHLPTDRLPHW